LSAGYGQEKTELGKLVLTGHGEGASQPTRGSKQPCYAENFTPGDGITRQWRPLALEWNNQNLYYGSEKLFLQ
jgi:hypothetical protein